MNHLLRALIGNTASAVGLVLNENIKISPFYHCNPVWRTESYLIKKEKKSKFYPHVTKARQINIICTC